MKKIVVLISGMDSLILFRLMQGDRPNDHLIPVWYNLDMSFSDVEERMLPSWVTERRHLPNYAATLNRIHDDGVDIFDSMFEWMVFDAIRHYKADHVVAGVLASDYGFYDNTSAWVNEFNERLGRDVLSYPFVDAGMSKDDIVKTAIMQGIDLNEAFKTHCCRSFLSEKFPNGCGSCWSCIRKRGVMLQNGFSSVIPSLKERPSQRVVDLLGVFANELLYDLKLDANHQKFLDEFMPTLLKDFDMPSDSTLEEVLEIVGKYVEENKHKLQTDLESVNEIR